MKTKIEALLLSHVILITLMTYCNAQQMVTCYMCDISTNPSCNNVAGNVTGFGTCQGQACAITSSSNNGQPSFSRSCINGTSVSNCNQTGPQTSSCTCNTTNCNGAFGYCDNCTISGFSSGGVPPNGGAPGGAPLAIPTTLTSAPNTGASVTAAPATTTAAAVTTAMAAAGLITCSNCSNSSCMAPNAETCQGTACVTYSTPAGVMTRTCVNATTPGGCFTSGNQTTCQCNSSMCNAFGKYCDSCNATGYVYTYQSGMVNCTQCGADNTPSCAVVDGAMNANNSQISTCAGQSCATFVSASSQSVIERTCTDSKMADRVFWNLYTITCICNDNYCNQVGLYCDYELFHSSAQALQFRPISALLAIFALLFSKIIDYNSW